MGKCKICKIKEEIPGTGYCFDCRPKSAGKQAPTAANNGVFFNTFYLDEAKEIPRPEIFLSAAKDLAEQLYYAKMGRGQIRNFLRYLRGIEFPLRLPSRPKFENLSWQLDELHSYAVYQSSRDKQPYPLIFKNFFDEYLPIIKSDKNEFIAFVKLMASVYAYFTEKEAIERSKRRDKR